MSLQPAQTHWEMGGSGIDYTLHSCEEREELTVTLLASVLELVRNIGKYLYQKSCVGIGPGRAWNAAIQHEMEVPLAVRSM